MILDKSITQTQNLGKLSIFFSKNSIILGHGLASFSQSSISRKGCLCWKNKSFPNMRRILMTHQLECVPACVTFTNSHISVVEDFFQSSVWKIPTPVHTHIPLKLLHNKMPFESYKDTEYPDTTKHVQFRYINSDDSTM